VVLEGTAGFHETHEFDGWTGPRGVAPGMLRHRPGEVDRVTGWTVRRPTSVATLIGDSSATRTREGPGFLFLPGEVDRVTFIRDTGRG
jgi:hypothetical protein